MTRIGYLAIVLLCLGACVDPTAPVFQLEDPFYLVEGQILAGEEPSKLRIQLSNFREAVKAFDPVLGATVVSKELGGATFAWEVLANPEEETAPGSYYPPAGFLASPGETWWFEITLPDGNMVVSDPEAIPEPVNLEGITLEFEQNSTFDEGRERFIPRFEIFLDYNDPPDQENYYGFDYRFFEEVIICLSCERGEYIPAQGGCVPNPSVIRYDYFCDTDDCFKVTEGNEAIYRNDDLTNGSTIRNLEIGGIPFDAYGGLLVEGVLYSLTEDAYAYGKVIENLTLGNSGLNATIPVALNGNVRNLDPTGKTVLGYLRAGSVARKRAFIDRTPDTGIPVPFDRLIRFAPGIPPRAPCEVDGRFAEIPEGWGG